ncbi:unnamed protein product [Oppiella nova]|uniref:C2H2-type domain-containing protein n=1 Tax=Oppiella nova TaxID=334625 RepID=A0A7R9QFM4_9ACAR|nr:unnamed protein product [Oppiella nova]CAG2164052.1 unnamed protein product [Oppiella nova]
MSSNCDSNANHKESGLSDNNWYDFAVITARKLKLFQLNASNNGFKSHESDGNSCVSSDGKTSDNSKIISDNESVAKRIGKHVCNYNDCTKRFTTRYRLNKHHKAVHLSGIDMTANMCYIDDCYKTCKSIEQLNRHIRDKHELRYRCDRKGCPFRTGLKASLTQHQLITYSKQKQFKCKLNDCNKSFKTIHRLRAHELGVHPDALPDIPWTQCSHTGCHFKTKSRALAINHRNGHKNPSNRRRHTQQKPYSCGICGQKFALMSEYKSHSKTHHSRHTAVNTRSTKMCDNQEAFESDNSDNNNNLVIIEEPMVQSDPEISDKSGENGLKIEAQRLINRVKMDSKLKLKDVYSMLLEVKRENSRLKAEINAVKGLNSSDGNGSRAQEVDESHESSDIKSVINSESSGDDNDGSSGGEKEEADNSGESGSHTEIMTDNSRYDLRYITQRKLDSMKAEPTDRGSGDSDNGSRNGIKRDSNGLPVRVKQEFDAPVDYRCDWKRCDYKTGREPDLRRHRLEHGFRCSLNGCDKWFKTETSQRQHQLRIHPKKFPYIPWIRCDVFDCQFKTKDKTSANSHIKRHNDNVSHGKRHRCFAYQCDDCGKRFQLLSILKIHLQEIHGKSFTESKEQIHNESAAKRIGKHVCNYNDCTKRFTTRYRLNKHHKAVHLSGIDMTANMCDQKGCPFRTGVKASLTQHQLITHSKQKQFKCKLNDCNKSFKTIHRLRAHELGVHPDALPDIPWTQCSYTGCHFKTKSRALAINHRNGHKNPSNRRRHTQQKPYSCGICGQKFALMSEYKSHSKTHHSRHTALNTRPTKMCDNQEAATNVINRVKMDSKLKLKDVYSMLLEVKRENSRLKAEINALKGLNSSGGNGSRAQEVDESHESSDIKSEMNSESSGDDNDGSSGGEKEEADNSGESGSDTEIMTDNSRYDFRRITQRKLDSMKAEPTDSGSRNSDNGSRNGIKRDSNGLPVRVKQEFDAPVDYRCDWKRCDYKTGREPDLRRHRLEHGFRCSVNDCDKWFKTETTLRQHHLRLHPSHFPYIPWIHCDVIGCHFKTKDKTSANSHIKRHNDNVNHGRRHRCFAYQCDDCGKRFQLLSILKIHLQAIHGKSFTESKEQIQHPGSWNSLMAQRECLEGTWRLEK